MPIGILFWVLMVLAFIFGFWWNRENPYNFLGNSALVFVLLFLLGWQVFGFVVQGPGAGGVGRP
jgi:lipopolysaccharide export LptBFGC system permease protein LptF